MGPVSFERIDGGPDRARALALAGDLGRAGIRVMSIDAIDGGCETAWQLTIRSADAAAARRFLSDR